MKKMNMKMKRFLGIGVTSGVVIRRLTSAATSVAVGGLVCGCQVLTYTSPTGERFTRSSLGANTSLQSLACEVTTNGLRRVELRGYQNDSAQALGAVTEAAVRAALQSVK